MTRRIIHSFQAVPITGTAFGGKTIIMNWFDKLPEARQYEIDTMHIRHMIVTETDWVNKKQKMTFNNTDKSERVFEWEFDGVSIYQLINKK